MSNQYVVFSATEVGIGHLLSALLHSAYYAFKTGRKLALDMRRFFYFSTDRHQRFLENFSWEFPHGLEVLTDLAEVERLLSASGTYVLRMDERLDIERPLSPQVVVIPCMAPGEPYGPGAKRPDQPFRITLRGELLHSWQEVQARPEWSRGVIGLHLRRPAGEILERMNSVIIPDFAERYRLVAQQYVKAALDLAQEAGLSSPGFFVASDDHETALYVKERLPNSFALHPRIPNRAEQSWNDHVVSSGFDIRVLSDAINDLWALSSCNYLICSQYSGYSQFAVVNGPKLDASRRFEIVAPTCEQIFDSLPPEQAVEWTRAALRKGDARRQQEEFLHRWVAKALERAGRHEEAAAAMRRARWQWEATFSPAVLVPGERIDLNEVANGKCDRAVEFARKIVARLPGNPYVLAGYDRSLSNLLGCQGRLEESVEVAREAVGIEPSDPYLHADLGRALLRQERCVEAETELRQALAIEPGNPRFLSNLARCLVLSRQIGLAIATLREAISAEPTNLQWHRELIDLLLSIGCAYEAEASVRTALKVRSENASLKNLLSVVLERQGRDAEAAAEVEAAIKLEPSRVELYYRPGEFLLKARRLDEAEAMVRRGLALRGDSAALHHMLSIVLEWLGRVDEAIEAAIRSAELDSLQSHRYVRVAELMLHANRLAEAEGVLRQAVELDPSSAIAHYFLSVGFAMRGNLGDAIASARQAVELAPDDQRWKDWLASVLERATRPAG